MGKVSSGRLGLLTGILALLALVAAGVPNRLAASWAFAAEQGRLSAARQELAGVQEVANAFRMVARVTMPGVVQINVEPSEADRKKFAELSRRAAELQKKLETEPDKAGAPEEPPTDGESEDAPRDTLLERAREKRELEVLRNRLEELDKRLSRVNGSGVIYDADGSILTNHHVVSDREKIRVRTNDGREYPARLVGDDPKTDLALIRIDAPDLQPLPFADSDKAEVGDWVLAVGAPFGLSQSVTHGIISAKGRTDVTLGRDILYRDFIQTDAAINPGNSGGPLVNIHGEVLGINIAIATEDGFNAGIAFVIPSNVARKVADQLRTKGKVSRGWLGVSLREISEKDAVMLGLRKPGVMVNVLYEGAAAEKAGLLCEDVILRVGDHPVANIAQLRDLVAEVAPGKGAMLTIWRDGGQREIPVTTDEQPDDIDAFSRSARAIRGRNIADLPLQLRTLFPGWLSSDDEESRLARAARNTYGDRNGVLVLERNDGAEQYDFAPFQLIYSANGKPVSTIVELERECKAASGRAIRLEVIEQDGSKRTIEFGG